MMSLGGGEPWSVQARGGKVGSEVQTGREGQSEKQVVWLQAGVDTEVPWAGYVGPRHNKHP